MSSSQQIVPYNNASSAKRQDYQVNHLYTLRTVAVLRLFLGEHSINYAHTKARGKDSLRANVFKLMLKLNLQATFRILQRVTLILIAA